MNSPEVISQQKKIIGYINTDFKWSAFVKPEDGIPPLEHLKNIKKVADILSIYKHKVFNNMPITITSGYRSLAHHLRVYKELGITDKSKIPMGSLHLKGLAADFIVQGWTNKQVYDNMDKVHFGGVEFPDNQNRIHIDLRTQLLRFKGTTGEIVSSHYNLESHNKIFHS